MEKIKMVKHLSLRTGTLMLLIVMLLAACQTAGPAPEVTQTEAIQPQSATATTKPSSTPVTPTATQAPPTATATTAPTATPQAYGPDNFPADVNPLTGLQVSDTSLLDRRPLAVKVQMFPRGQRPPWGVSLADIVYDFYQNFGATRFNAIFYGHDASQVGPIRSGRMLDRDIVQMYQAIFAFGSADQRILNYLYNSSIGDRMIIPGPSACPPLCRIDPNGFNYLVADTEKITQYAEENNINNERQDLNGMSFDPTLAEGGADAGQVFVRYNFSNYNRWDYDEASHRYLRFQETENDEGNGESYAPLLDRLNDQQIAADNVVILFATHDFAFNTRPGQNEIVDIRLSGSGSAYAFRNGQGYELRWNRPTPDATLFLTFPDGEPYPYKPGNTWYQVIGQSSQVESGGNAGEAWRFTFSIP
jgi:hypothetical protein